MEKKYSLKEVKEFMSLARDYGERHGIILYDDFLNNLFHTINLPSPAIVTRQDLINIIYQEGIGYAVQHYYGKNIECPEDRVLEQLWKDTYDALEKLTVYINE